MKATKSLFVNCCCVIAFGLFLVIGPSPHSAVFAVQQSVRGSSTPYNFPIKPGTAEWAALKSHDEMLKACEIPQDILDGMTTENLVTTVLNYPLYGDILAYNSIQQGFDTVASGFNGLRELLRRQDAGSVLLTRYKKMNPAAPREDWSLVKRGNFDRSFTYIETLLSQDAILAHLTKVDRRQLIADTLVKNHIKGQFPEVYGQFGRERVVIIMGRLLKLENFQPLIESTRSNTDIDIFLREGSFTTEMVLSEISALAQNLLSVGLIGHNSTTRPFFVSFNKGFADSVPTTVYFASVSSMKTSAKGNLTAPDYASFVYTPRGSAVSVIVATYELSPAQIAANNNWVATYYPQAVRETDASRRYNCHSYAWHSNSVFNDKWMNDPGDNTYWNDGSFVPSYAVGAANRKVSYAYGDHSAITIDAITFRSKWGQLPRMRHAYNYCPYNSSALYYYQQA